MGGCFVPGCKSGHGNDKGSHLFCPKKSVGLRWSEVMKQIRKDKIFDPGNKNHKICSKHFEETFIRKSDYFKIDGKDVYLPRKNWTLEENAIPTVFPDLPVSIRPNVPKKRRILQKVDPVMSKRTRTNKISEDENSQPVEIGVQQNDFYTKWTKIQIDFPEWNTVDDNSYWSVYTLVLDNGRPVVDKSITVPLGNEGQPSLFIRDIEVTKFLPAAKDPRTEFGDLVKEFSALSICHGVNGYSSFLNIKGGTHKDGKWFSETCEAVSEAKVCLFCKKLHLSLQKKGCRHVKKKSSNSTNSIKRRLKYYQRKSVSLAMERKTLRRELLQIKTSIHQISLGRIESELETTSVPLPMRSNILHCLKTIKTKCSKGLRYSSDWLLECLLLKIKSPTAYRHLRDAKILPLPHPSTLAKLIASQRCEFGFNKYSLAAIQKEYEGKSRRDRQGILCFDEIQLRESLDFNKHTGRFDGYIDYAEYNTDLVSEKDNSKLANHALVIMYRPFNSNWVQPIAAFATKNAANGTALHKVILEAIVKLESIGAEVLTVVCDGSKPNKSFWRMCGVGKFKQEIVNKVEHPCDSNRPLFFCNDFPHLFKCIRNNMLKYGSVDFFQGEVDFSFYEILLVEDSRRGYGLRKCPKLTRSHVNPNNFEKMIVPLATQLFSNSVATGLCYYRKCNVTGFGSSEYTEIFTRTMNNVFDALNCKLTKDGMRIGGKYYNVLVEFRHELSNYIRRLERSPQMVPFASLETLVALQVTICSTVDIVEYLINDLGFSYVLTGKITQDCLEKFFGLIRAAGGREDHPTVSNFIQLFRLLSLYNPVKRLLRGNVRSDDNVDVLVSYEKSLREASKEYRQSKKTDKITIEEAIVSKLHELQDGGLNIHNGNNHSTLDKNIIYHLAGFLCFKAEKFLGCDKCVNSISVNQPEARDFSTLTDILTYGKLHHPSKEFFTTVLSFETAIRESIEVHATCGDIIMDCIYRLSLNALPKIGCGSPGHLEEVITALFPYYITMRLHFYARSMRNDIGRGKATKNKRKESKLKS